MSRGICFGWEKGTCERGDSCKFEHIGESGANPNNAEADIVMTKKCHRFYRTGACKFGDECKFAHIAKSSKASSPKSSNGTAPGNSSAPKNGPKKRRKSSKRGGGSSASADATNGANGANGGATTATSGAAKVNAVCFRWLKGGDKGCRFGSDCRYNHFDKKNLPGANVAPEEEASGNNAK